MPNIGQNQPTTYGDYLRANGRRGFDWRYPAIALGGPLAGAGIGAIGAGAGGAAASAGASTAPVSAGGAMTFGNLLKLGELGAGLTTQLIGQRQNNRALDRDAAQRQNEYAQQIALTQQAQAEAKRQWEAQQAFEAQKFAASEEERLHARQLLDEREARRAPYRAMSQQALMRLGDLLRLGRG